MTFRTERDPLGERQVPSDAYYGIQTLRATENFPTSPLKAPSDLVTATILIKNAAAELAKESVRTGVPIRQLALERKLLDAEQLERILDPQAMTQPGVAGATEGGAAPQRVKTKGDR